MLIEHNNIGLYSPLSHLLLQHILSTCIVSHSYIIVYCRTSYYGCTCCLRKRTYTIGTLRFCKRVSKSTITVAPCSRLYWHCTRNAAYKCYALKAVNITCPFLPTSRSILFAPKQACQHLLCTILTVAFSVFKVSKLVLKAFGQ